MDTKEDRAAKYRERRRLHVQAMSEVQPLNKRVVKPKHSEIKEKINVQVAETLRFGAGEGVALIEMLKVYSAALNIHIGAGHIAEQTTAKLTRSKTRLEELHTANVGRSALRAAHTKILRLESDQKDPIHNARIRRSFTSSAYRRAKTLGIGVEIAKKEYADAAREYAHAARTLKEGGDVRASKAQIKGTRVNADYVRAQHYVEQAQAALVLADKQAKAAYLQGKGMDRFEIAVLNAEEKLDARTAKARVAQKAVGALPQQPAQPAQPTNIMEQILAGNYVPRTYAYTHPQVQETSEEKAAREVQEELVSLGVGSTVDHRYASSMCGLGLYSSTNQLAVLEQAFERLQIAQEAREELARRVRVLRPEGDTPPSEAALTEIAALKAYRAEWYARTIANEKDNMARRAAFALKPKSRDLWTAEEHHADRTRIWAEIAAEKKAAIEEKEVEREALLHRRREAAAASRAKIATAEVEPEPEPEPEPSGWVYL